MNTIKIIAGVIVTIIILDILFALMWIFSGQVPVDNFYFGSFTVNIIKLIG
jgi:hypothetical protein